MSGPTIVLTGFMGTGKSSTGRALAAATGRPFVDTDEEIVAREGRGIADIFATDGERYFRTLERGLAQELAGRDGLVIATGGRMMLDPVGGLLLSRDAAVVCLTAAPETIVARLAQVAEARPLLAGPHADERVRELLERRAFAYSRFPQLATDGKEAAQVAAEALALSEQLGRDGRWRERLVSQIDVSYSAGRYPIYVGRGLLRQLPALHLQSEQAVVVSDDHVAPLYGSQLAGFERAPVITFPAGEANKNLATVAELYRRFLAAGLERQGMVLALGGGVVGDVAGFAAATYLRGVDLVHCPTSLLAMVDASIGGKSGVDLPEGKNLVGAFKQPRAVVADLRTLDTLPGREFACGMAETIKHALIGRPELLERLEGAPHRGPADRPPLELQLAIVEAILVKRVVVEADPFEAGPRLVLNLGHTFAHGIEQATGYGVRHGEAVAIGLVAAARLSAALGYCDPRLPEQIEALLRAHWLPVKMPPGLVAADVLQAMGADKKRRGGRLHYVLLRAAGDAFVTADVSEEDALRTVEGLAHEA
jgi:3-dehydroquinate synthase